MSDSDIQWGNGQVNGYTTYTVASTNSNTAYITSSASNVDWDQRYTVYQPAQFQQQWFTWNDVVQQPITEESRRIMDGWDPDCNV